jgi:hypothetical protein
VFHPFSNPESQAFAPVYNPLCLPILHFRANNHQPGEPLCCQRIIPSHYGQNYNVYRASNSKLKEKPDINSTGYLNDCLHNINQSVPDTPSRLFCGTSRLPTVDLPP